MAASSPSQPPSSAEAPASIVGRVVYCEYEGLEPALGVVTACSLEDDGEASALFLDGFQDEAFSPKQLRGFLTPDKSIYTPDQWLQSVKAM